MSETSEPAGWDADLADGERLLWHGRPNASIRFLPQYWVVSAFGLVFLGVGLFELIRGRALGFDLLSVVHWTLASVFFLGGLYMVAGVYLADAIDRRRTRYALTNRRALIAMTKLGARSVTSHMITGATDLELRGEAPASVLFADELHEYEDSRERIRIGFDYIADAKQVYELMRKIQNGTA
ncbi:hypothetical protein DEA8626_02460 [Defluviimonas aquaemixtae]|uniref:DUF304 domain-containing protein n=1 Tax=Albidovulum aquaemixtae TaxID=1542388 RepID=A0A2R8BJ70_9RHOB|nr:hypothetical protein [Defluviimonas aquaemixtae]SPH23396.1 hypothetical protein DEA8626_02460 [Defluviimonas aquaemixtae]